VVVADRVWEDWRAQSADSSKPWIALLFSSELDTDEARRKLAEAVQRVVSEFERGHDDLTAGAWNMAKVPEGVMLTVGEKCGAFELLLKRVAEDLEKKGLTGAFDLYELPEVPRPPKLTDLVEARLRVRGERVPQGYRHRWAAEPQALWRVASAGVGWCLENRADQTVTFQVRTIPPLPVRATDDVDALLREGIESAAGLGYVALRSIGADRFRSLAVEPSQGRVTLVAGGSSISANGWVDAVADLTELLRRTSGDLVYGFVKRGSFTQEAEAGWSLTRDWPQPGPSKRGEAFEDGYVPDAFGIQLLGPAFAGRIPSGPDWGQTRLDGGRVLLEHREPEAWFRGPRLEDSLKGISTPSADLLTAARADFAAMLFRDEPH
jgi:hypothetical protein